GPRRNARGTGDAACSALHLQQRQELSPDGLRAKIRLGPCGRSRPHATEFGPQGDGRGAAADGGASATWATHRSFFARSTPATCGASLLTCRCCARLRSASSLSSSACLPSPTSIPSHERLPRAPADSKLPKLQQRSRAETAHEKLALATAC